MKIGIMSDSHRDTRHTALFVEHLKNEGAEYLIHAGDLEHVENLQSLHGSGLHYVSVFGNNDSHLKEHAGAFNIYSEPHYFAIGELKIKLMHMPFYLSPDGADIIIYGHTHQVKLKYNQGLLVLNPGEICARETGRHECLLLEVETGHYRIRHFYKTKQNEIIEENITEFIRP